MRIRQKVQTLLRPQLNRQSAAFSGWILRFALVDQNRAHCRPVLRARSVPSRTCDEVVTLKCAGDRSRRLFRARDKVDFHTWTLLKGVAVSILLGVGSELALAGDSDLVCAIRLSTQNSSARAGDQIASRNLNIQPTITTRPGARGACGASQSRSAAEGMNRCPRSSLRACPIERLPS